MPKVVIQELKSLFERDLNRLKNEVSKYTKEDMFWISEHGSINNSGGNLCLHLIGNLKTYIGQELGGIAYKRDRNHEFDAKHVSRREIYREIDETIQAVNQGLDSISEDQLLGDFPVLIWDNPTGMVYTLIHLHCHLNYHLGQINYHRRLVDIYNGSTNQNL